MLFNERRQLLEQLESKEFRDALVDSDIANGILFQLKSMLGGRSWTQDELAERAETSQPVISKYLRGYDNFSLKTLKRLASAFDVSLTVRFERFSELVNRYLGLGSEDLNIPSFNDDAPYRPIQTLTTHVGEPVTPTANDDHLHGLISAKQMVALAARHIDENEAFADAVVRWAGGTAAPEEESYVSAA